MCKIFEFEKRKIIIRKSVLNPSGWSEICKIKIYPTVFHLNLKYTWPVFYLNSNTPHLYLTHSSELTGLTLTHFFILLSTLTYFTHEIYPQKYNLKTYSFYWKIGVEKWIKLVKVGWSGFFFIAVGWSWLKWIEVGIFFIWWVEVG